MRGPEFKLIPVGRLFTSPDARKVGEDAVHALASSIRVIGMTNPINIRRMPTLSSDSSGEAYQVIAGETRRRAAISIGLNDVPCLIFEDDDLHAELRMIDENICRNDFGTGDLYKALAQRKKLYEAVNPQTAKGASQANGMNKAIGRNVETENVPTFTQATAKVVGRSQSYVKQAVERGTKVSQDIVDLLRGTARDRPGYYEKLKDMPADEQAALVQQDLERDSQTDYLRRRSSASTIHVSAAEGKAAADKKCRLHQQHRASVANFITDRLTSTDLTTLRSMIDNTKASDFYQSLLKSIETTQRGRSTSNIAECNIDDP